MSEILAIIPARGGSKGLKRKNIKPMAGKPLIAWTIDIAVKCSLINRIIVSTDDREISDISIRCGAEVPFLRPEQLAQDDTPDFPVYKNVINWLAANNNYKPDIVIWLRPTSPLRTVEDINSSVDLIRHTDTYFVRSVTECKNHPYWTNKIENGYLKPFINDVDISKYYQRQLLPKAYVPNGSVDVIKCAKADNANGFYTKNARAYIMPSSRSIDIDNENDFILAEQLLNKYAKNN